MGAGTSVRASMPSLKTRTHPIALMVDPSRETSAFSEPSAVVWLSITRSNICGGKSSTFLPSVATVSRTTRAFVETTRGKPDAANLRFSTPSLSTPVTQPRASTSPSSATSMRFSVMDFEPSFRVTS